MSEDKTQSVHFPDKAEAMHFDDEALDDLKLRLKILTGMDVWTKTQVARRALSLLKEDLAERLKAQNKWQEYQEKKGELE